MCDWCLWWLFVCECLRFVVLIFIFFVVFLCLLVFVWWLIELCVVFVCGSGFMLLGGYV